MERLPDELLLIITTHCDFNTLKTTRLISHRFLALTTPLVFEHFYMGLFERDFQNFQKLAQSSLAKHVKRITFFPDVLPHWSQDDWRAEIDFRPRFVEYLESYEDTHVNDNTAHLDQVSQHQVRRRLAWRAWLQMPAHDLSNDRLDEGYEAYLACVEEQRAWPKKRYDVAFQQLLKSLPNLSDASVKDSTCREAAEWPVWKRLRQQIFVAPPFEVAGRARKPIGWPFLHPSAYITGCVLSAIQQRASLSSTRKVTALNICAFQIYHDWIVLRGQEPYHQLQLADAFQWLTSLHFHIPNATSERQNDGHAMAQAAMLCLVSACRVRKVYLSYSNDDFRTVDDDCSLEPLFGMSRAIWPEIEELSMIVDLPASTLIKFMSKHASTLKSFELQDSLVRDVRLLVAQVPRITKLDHVYFKLLWDQDEQGDHHCFFARGTDIDAPYESSIKAYLTGQTADLPEVKRDGRHGHPEDWGEPGLVLDELLEDEDYSGSEDESAVDGEDEFQIGVEGGDDEVEDEDEVEEDEELELLVEGGDDFDPAQEMSEIPNEEGLHVAHELE